MLQAVQGCLLKEAKEGDNLAPGERCNSCGIKSGEIGKTGYGVIMIRVSGDSPEPEHVCRKHVPLAEVVPHCRRIEIHDGESDQPREIIQGERLEY